MHSTSTATPRAQTDVQHLLERLVATGRETGIQVAAYLDGELVVDAWAGQADPERGRPIHGDTLIDVWSAGKAVAARSATRRRSPDAPAPEEVPCADHGPKPDPAEQNISREGEDSWAAEPKSL